MTRRWKIVTVAVAIGAVVLAFFLYDRSQADVIASGVRVAGVGVGSLTAREAEARLRGRLLPRLRQPIVVSYPGRSARLSARMAAVSADVRAAVRAAVERSRRGNLVTRLRRELTGGRVQAEIPLPVGYSRSAVRAFVRRLARSVDRAPQRGRVIGRARSLEVIPARRGVVLLRAQLERELGAALRSVRASRALRAPTRALTPSLPQQLVAAAIDALARRVERPARNARVIPSPDALLVEPARNGVALRRESLRREVIGAIVAPGRPRVLPAATRVVAPRVTTAKLMARYPYFITVSRAEKRLRLFEHLRLAKTYVVAIGRVGYETPAGLYHVDWKQVDPPWYVPKRPWAGKLAGTVVPPNSAENPLKARWMGFYDGAGIHGTDDLGSLGQAASHGCIRMSIPDVIELYGIVPLHTPLYIA